MLINNNAYFAVLDDIKSRIKMAQYRKSQRVVGFLPWRNNITLMTKVKDENARQWYIKQNIENGWNNTALNHPNDNKPQQGIQP